MTAPQPESGTATPGATGAGGSKNLALAAMLFAVAMTFIDQTIVAIASPSIQSHLGLSRTGVTWAVNAYLLALAAIFALGGRLADVLGSKVMVLIGIVGFAASSALCGATPTGSAAETWLVVFRVVQGISGAIMVPAALAIVVAAFPVRERGKALAIFFGVSGGLTSIGPIAGGFLTQWTWRAIFWINIPVAVLALVLTLMAKIPTVRRHEPIDYRGAVLVAAGMALSVLGFEQATTWHWSSPLTWLCIIGGLVILAGFVAFERGVESPLIKVRIFTNKAFVIDNLVLFFSTIAFIPVFFFASIYSQVSLGFNANQAGLYLLLFFAGFAPAAQIGGRMLDRGGARRPVRLGCALGVVGFALWAWKMTDLSLGAQWWAIVISGAGLGLLLGPASTDAVNRSINASYGEVTGITQTVRNYSSTLGIAVLGTLLNSVFISRLTHSIAGLKLAYFAGGPSDVASALAHSSSAGSGGANGHVLPDIEGSPAQQFAVLRRIQPLVQHDFALANRAVFIGMAIALGLAFLAARLHPGDVAADEETAAASGAWTERGA